MSGHAHTTLALLLLIAALRLLESGKLSRSWGALVK